MKIFLQREIREAYAAAAAGGVALHICDSAGLVPASAPGCFRRSAQFAHMFDQDYNRMPGQGDRKGQRPRTHSLKSPAPTVTGSGHMHLVEPAILPQHGGGVMRSVKKPAPTVATDGVLHLVEAFLVKYYGTGKSASIKKPLPTVTTKDRFALCCPVVIRDGKMARVRIRWRILEPDELAAAQGFRKDYKFYGARRRNGKVIAIEQNANKGDVVKQIGNAWPHHLARALMLAALTQTRDIRPYLREWNRRAA